MQPHSHLLSIFLMMLSITVVGQNIKNGGFEEARSGEADGWVALTGNVLAVEKFSIQRPEELLTVRPLKGERMLKMQNTNIVASASTEPVFFNYKPAALFVHYIYFGNEKEEQPQINVLMSRWDTTMNTRDTIMWLSESLDSLSSIFWKRKEINLIGHYRTDAKPDTAIVFFQTSTQPARKGSTLLLDEIWFSEWIKTDVGDLDIVQNMYPNPANRGAVITIESPHPLNDIQLCNALGEQLTVHVRQTSTGFQECLLHQEVNSGLWFFSARLVDRPEVRIRKKLVVN